MSKIVFVGGVFPKDSLEEIQKKCKRRPQLAANNYQWSLISGFDANLDEPVSILNRKYVGSFPRNYRDLIVRGKQFSHTAGAIDYDLGFINLSVVRNYVHPFHEKRYIRQLLAQYSNCVFFFYSIGERNLRIANFIKKTCPESTVVFYIPDLPEYVMLSVKQNYFVRLHRKKLQRKVVKTICKSDVNVLVSKYQVERLNVDPNSCMVVEAMAETDQREFVPLKKNTPYRIVYAGTLAKQYNILHLIDEFKKTKRDDIELIICGDGDAKNVIIKEAENDKRIKYLGILNKQDLNTLYNDASLLVNPRLRQNDYTKYSFPSKTIDYLLSGRPVLCQKLAGIPDEYDDYLIYFDETHMGEHLADRIEQLSNMSIDEINEIGRRNFEFVKESKNNIFQTKRILQFVESRGNSCHSSSQEQ